MACLRIVRNGPETGWCPYCSTNIKHDMTRHVSSFHLDLGQLWRCPVSWCTQWKGTPQDCVDHICKKHYHSVKADNLGRWFPPWTVTKAAWHTALKTMVWVLISGILPSGPAPMPCGRLNAIGPRGLGP